MTKQEFPLGKESYCPRCYFEDDKRVLRENCPHNKDKQLLSQCPHCLCMTKTIKGKCGKCGELKTTETWRELQDLLQTGLGLEDEEAVVAGNILKEFGDKILQSTLDEATKEARESGYSHGWSDSEDVHYKNNQNKLKEQLEMIEGKIEDEKKKVRADFKKDGRIQEVRMVTMGDNYTFNGEFEDEEERDIYIKALDQVHDIIKNMKGK